jgi:hypothetical protein
MKNFKLKVIIFNAVVLTQFCNLAFSEDKVTAKSFADSNGNLDIQQAAIYIIYRDKEPLSKFVLPNHLQVDPVQVVEKMEDKLDDLRSKTGHQAPWTWQELDAGFSQPDEVSAWKHIKGLTTKNVFNKDSILQSVGPILLRNSASDISKSLSDAKGITLNYSKNDLIAGSGVFNTTGIMDYPTLWNIYQGGKGKSVEMGVDFTSQWNVAQTQNDQKKDVEELTFAVPFTIYLSGGSSIHTRNLGSLGNNDKIASSGIWIFQTKPYFQTDFGFRHEIYGVEENIEFVGSILGSRAFALGGYQDTRIQNLQYQIRLIPKLDYSVTEQSGIHTTRKVGDDWLRIGSLGSFDLRFGLQTFKALDLGFSYQFLQAVKGNGGYSDIIKARTTLWLIENVGLTFEYTNGDTPVANKAIDLLSLGLEIKY